MRNNAYSGGHLVLAGCALVGALAAAPRAHALPAPAYAASPARSNITPKMREFIAHYDRAAAIKALPADAGKYRYVLGKGLFGNTYPFYMARNAKVLRAAGLDVEFAKIRTAGYERENVEAVKNMIRTTTKPIVFQTHSQASATVSQAIGELYKSEPEVVRKNVRGFVSLEGANRGSSVADVLMSSKVGRAFAHGLTRIVGGRIDGIGELQTKFRVEQAAASPVPTDVVPTVAMIGYQRNYRSIVGLGTLVLKRLFGVRSDGLVGTRSAGIPGADVYRLPISHAQAAWGKYSEMLSIGSISHVLSMPYGVAAD